MSTLANSPDMTADTLIEVLVEANVLTALNTYEALVTKLEIIEGLRARIEKNELENAVRDYVAQNPWLVSPQWDTFKKETSLKTLIAQLAKNKGIKPEEEWDRRIDLLLASGDQILILEFMQPGKRIDRDHVSRFEYYVETVREFLRGNTGMQFRNCTGYLIANKINNDGAILRMIDGKKDQGLFYLDWETLLMQAERQYAEFLEILRERAPQDSRLKKFQPTQLTTAN